jgi:drug/metabolite transporter (DMT)-like permease
MYVSTSGFSPLVRAAFLMVGAILAFSTMTVAGREAGAELDTFEIMTYRSVVGIGIVCLIGWWSRTLSSIRTERLGLHALRNLSHFAGQNLWFLAITLIPLAQVVALEFTSPIWVLLLSPLILGERMTLVRILGVCLGFIGVLIVVRPSVETLSPGVLAAALAAIGFAGSLMLTKRLTRTESITCILFYLTTMQAVFGLICAGYDAEMHWPSVQVMWWVVLIGFAGLAAHFCLTQALRLAPAMVIVPIDFARIPLIATIGAVVYAESLDIYVIVGAAVIFAANYLNIWNERRLSGQAVGR